MKMIMQPISSIFSKYKTKGTRWFLQRIFRELCAPTTLFSVGLAWLFKKPLYWLLIKPIDKLKKSNTAANKDALLLIYDLSVEPVTYNFIFSLAIASYQCELNQLMHIDVLIIKGEYHQLRKEEDAYEVACPVAARHWRTRAILWGAVNLMPAFRHLFYTDKEQARDLLSAYDHRYPTHYTLTSPVTHFPRDVLVDDARIRGLRADAQSLAMMRRWLNARAQGRPVITITLRESPYCPARNSDIDSWLKVAENLDREGYYVVFVTDTENPTSFLVEKLATFTCCPLAAVNVQLRMALYELSTLCLGINNGPMVLCWFNDRCRYITFKIVTESVTQTSRKVLMQYGFVEGEPPLFAHRDRHVWIWEDDQYPLMMEAIQKVLTIETYVSP